MNKQSGTLRTLLFAGFATFLLSAPIFCNAAYADDRSAGTLQHKDIFSTGKKADKKTYKPRNASKTLDTDIKALESRGLLFGATGGSLGPYLWEHGSKELVFRLLEDLPDDNHYSTLYNLTERALLTAADSTQLSGNRATKINEGRDFLTLRLEGLYRMGKFDSAAALYTQSPFEPYHERQARVGVQALYVSGQLPLACLETNAIKDRFDGIAFWQKMSLICDMAMFNKSDEINASTEENAEGEGKQFLSIYFENKNKMFAPESLEILSKPSIIDISWLIQNNKISYKELGSLPPAEMPAALRAVLLTDDALPTDLKESIEAYISSYDKGLEATDEKPEIKRESFTSGTARKQLFSYIAYLVANNFTDVEVLPKDKVIELIDSANPIDRALVGIILEKLDKQSKLHNYVDREIYEKHADLTFDDNYVMQSTGLVNSLRKAKNENCLGEVILLTSIILHKTPPENLRPDVFGEVIDSFVTVGLIYEAHKLATEVLLGF